MKTAGFLGAIAVVACLALAASGPCEDQMTTYWVGLVRKGPAWKAGNSPELRKLQEEHQAHIMKMAETGKLLLAGPFLDDGDLRGMGIYRVESLEEAKAMADQDPAVKAGHLVREWHPWYGPKNVQVTPWYDTKNTTVTPKKQEGAAK